MTKRHLIKVYREAAEAIDEHDRWSCCVVHDLTSRGEDGWTPETALYRNIMINNSDYPWDGLSDWHTRRDVRVLLLLLMGEWVRTDYKAM